MEKNNIYVFILEYNDNIDFKVNNNFSKYRLNKIGNITNYNKIQENILTEYFMNYTYNIVSSKKEQFPEIIMDEKPRFKHNNLFFSISHTENIIAIAYSGTDVSLDIETIKDRTKLSKKILNKEEIQTYDNLLYNEKIKYIIKKWTIKESYIKYFGKSIYNNIKDISINDYSIYGKYGKLIYETSKYKNTYLTVSSKENKNIIYKTIDIKKLNIKCSE